MANVDAPFGFRPAKHLNGNPYNGSVMKCYMPTGDTKAVYIGDLMEGAGSACANGCCPSVKKFTGCAAAAKPGLGSLVAVMPSTSASLIYRAASTERYVEVCVDPDVLYEAQTDETMTKGDCGALCLVVSTHAGSTVTGLSGMEIDATIATTNTYPFIVVSFVDRPDNDIASTNSIWLVLWNTHAWRVLTHGTKSKTGAMGAVGI